MYGVTSYLRDTCEFYAAQGYLTIAPALYDRRQRGLVLEYTKENHDLAQKIYKSWNWDHALDDLDAGKNVVLASRESCHRRLLLGRDAGVARRLPPRLRRRCRLLRFDDAGLRA